jgi:hypothetical protein
MTGGRTNCYGGNLSGGPISGAPPEFPPAANLTPGGELAHWSDADIVRALREGAPRRLSAQSTHALESHPLYDRRRNPGVDALPAINLRPVILHTRIALADKDGIILNTKIIIQTRCGTIECRSAGQGPTVLVMHGGHMNCDSGCEHEPFFLRCDTSDSKLQKEHTHVN